MAITLYNFSPNTQAKSSEVSANDAALKAGVEDSAYRSFAWQVNGALVTGNEQGFKYIIPQGLTLKALYVKTTSGTCVIALQKDTTDLVTGVAVGSTIATTYTFTSNTITAGQILTLDITGVTSAIDLFVTLECQVTTIA